MNRTSFGSYARHNVLNLNCSPFVYFTTASLQQDKGQLFLLSEILGSQLSVACDAALTYLSIEYNTKQMPCNFYGYFRETIDQSVLCGQDLNSYIASQLPSYIHGKMVTSLDETEEIASASTKQKKIAPNQKQAHMNTMSGQMNGVKENESAV